MTSNLICVLTFGIIATASAFAASLDPSFGSNGKVTTAVGSGNDLAQAVAIYTDGRIVAAGYAFNGNNNDFALVRYMPNGAVDISFGLAGIAMIPVGTSEDEAFSCVIQPDGKIVAAGQTYDGLKTSFAVIRLNADGTLDQTFNGTGRVVVTPSSWNALIRSVALQPDGKTVLAGVGSNGLNFDIIIARLNADGSLDTGFGIGGVLTRTVGSGNDQAYGVAVQNDGKIVIGGYYQTPTSADTVVLRLMADGSPDLGFGLNGVAIHSFSSDVDEALAMSLAPDGRIVLAGCIRTGAPNDFLVARLMPDGSADQSFGVNGLTIVPFVATTDIALGVAVQGDGKVVAAGLAFNGSKNDFAVVRLTANGLLDQSFGEGGKTTTMIGSSADVANAVAVAPDGTIVAAGRTVSNTADFGIVKYRSGIASISGRVLSPAGAALRDLRVNLVDPGGAVRFATTSSFGIFSFENVATIDGYTLTVRSKRYRFAPTPMNVAGNVTNIEIFGLE